MAFLGVNAREDGLRLLRLRPGGQAAPWGASAQRGASVRPSCSRMRAGDMGQERGQQDADDAQGFQRRVKRVGDALGVAVFVALPGRGRVNVFVARR